MNTAQRVGVVLLLVPVGGLLLFVFGPVGLVFGVPAIMLVASVLWRSRAATDERIARLEERVEELEALHEGADRTDGTGSEDGDR
jgi:hypothetical protein